ncbi:hypothetical protein PI95_011435 [Hassallia byssoidea VB512170]|uniref:Fimbrial protein n=1 Tax=Hassallia byssoidea VB512170 TaxID=1304833 RepID=A0A846H884_9CYAN|nr:hypothetical protein [Hassalia byssoidea]NEU73158.1 hypothetical protein [Hassalia byssoidea VB512170]
MLRRSLFACALMLAGVVGFASSAKAGTASLNFPVTVGSFCTLGTTTDGTLGVNTINEGLGTDGTTYTIGTAAPGKINLECSKDAKLGVTIAEGSTNPTTGATLTAALKTTDGTATVGNDHTLTKYIKEEASVDMTATLASGTKFIPGSYTYTVTVTSTP